ncbi:nucleoporin Nup186/Nup192/Nup205 [Cyathus striatus]|nr:nucleoporin Nup186/Nup192/Nup205 [Cyathus striatus]
MDSISRLKDVLAKVMAHQDSHYDEQELFDELMVQKPRLMKVLDFGHMNDQEKKELESGKTIVDDKPVAVNSDFARQAIFLAVELNCSEREAASVLHSVMSRNPNISPANSMELTVEQFHGRRRAITDCIRFLMEITQLAYVPSASSTIKHISEFVQSELLPQIGEQGGETALAHKILNEIEYMDVVMGRADMIRKNAGSNTIAPTAQTNPALGFEIVNARCESLKYERRFFTPNEVKALIKWLTVHPNHPMTYYLLTAAFLAFDPADPKAVVGYMRHKLATDHSLMSFMKSKLDISTEWKDPGMKAAILLKWTLLLTDTRHIDPNLEHQDGFKTEDLETWVWNAVQGDAFSYLAIAVAQIERKRGASPAASLIILPSNEQEQRDILAEDFKLIMLTTFETLVRLLITHASSELRKIKQRQEDIVLASGRDRARQASLRYASGLASDSDRQGPPPRHDIAMLYSFIGLLYSALPLERGLQFWGAGVMVEVVGISYMQTVENSVGRLPSFLQWAVWSTPIQDTTMLTALYDMLNGLSKGRQCSELAHNFMARGGGEILPGNLVASSSGGASISWSTIFNLLESWQASAIAPKGPHPQHINPNQPFTSSLRSIIPPQVSQAPQFAISPKEVLLAQSFLRLLSTVVTYSIAVRTTIAGHAHLRAIPTLISLIPLGIPLELKGAIFDVVAAFCEPGAGVPGIEICKAVWTLMERLEVINVRTQTPSGFVVAAGKGVELELEQIESVYHLYPATIPFLKLLSTLLHTPKRVPFRERALGAEPINTIPENLGQPYRIPGISPFTSFVIDNVFANIPNREYARPSDRWQMNDLCICFIERSLASFDLESLVTASDDAPLKNEFLVSLLMHPGYDIMQRLLTASPLQETILSTIVRVLRIVRRVLEIQDIFLDVLISLLSDFDNVPFIGTIHSRSYYTRFDQALSFVPQYIPALATYMAYPGHSELALLSVKIVATLSLSLSASSLATLIERSENSERILGSFIHLLTSASMDDVEQAEEIADQTTGAGAPDIDQAPQSYEQAIRIAALDLLIQNTEMSRPYPNIGHFLLFGGSTRAGFRRSSIHTLLDLVNNGIPSLKSIRGDRDHHGGIQTTPLFITLPTLAEPCYRILTSEFTSRYLRTREHFFARQLAAISHFVPVCHQGPYVEVVYIDGSRITTTVPTLTSFLRLRSFIYDLVALELHVLTNKGHAKGVTELLEILFGNDIDYEDEDELPTFHELGQSHMRIISFLQSLMFDWSDSLAVGPITLQFLNQLNLSGCFRKDNTGCDIVDRTALLLLLSTGRRALHSQGVINTSAHAEQLSHETTYILESCTIENRRRKVAHAIMGGFEAWRKLLGMALTKCFDRLPHDRRENMLFDLLHSTIIEETTATLLAETVLSYADSGSLPAERLYSILRDVLEGIIDNNHLELVRGNLYAALINFIHLISPSLIHSDASYESHALIISTSMDVVPHIQSSLVPGSLALLKPVMERLVAIISRDATDGTEVWKTIAFMLLDALVQLSGSEKQYVLSALNRHGILTNFVRGIKESDTRLQSVLKPDPEDLNPLYVYEAKMSLFIRMSQTRAGAERLLESQLIPILAQCDYLDARPEADQSFMDQDSFLPSAIQRYHQLFMPVLQVVAGILAVLSNKHATATNQALDFLTSHGSTIVILLKYESDQISTAFLEEIHLIVTLCANVLPSVPKSELLSANSGFGAIHAAILGLSTTCLGRGRCFNVVPTTDAEIQDSGIYAYGFSSESKFGANVRRKDRLLRKSIVAYVGVASDYTEPEITLVLSPITTLPKHDGKPSISTTTPTIGDALGALRDICNDLAEMLKQVADLSAELANRDQIQVHNVHETLNSVNGALLQELDVGQKRLLLCQELEGVKRMGVVEAKILLDTAEMLLLLIWRHLEYYSEPRNMNTPPVKASLSNVMRLLATSEPEAFCADVGQKIAPVLQRLGSFELDVESVGKDWKSHQAYIEVMCRRLRDTAGLHEASTMQEGE